MRLGPSLSLTRRRSKISSFAPASLFGVNDNGAAIDFSDRSQLFQSNNGTTPVAAIGDPIGYASDQSGKSKPLSQATAASKPSFSGVPRTLGAEVLSNGRFASDTVWAKGTGWGAISGGKCPKTAGVASVLSDPTVTLPPGAYFVTYHITRTAGTITPQFAGGTTVSGIAHNATGSYCHIMIAVSGNNTFQMSADAAFAGSVDNISVKPITSYVNFGARFPGGNQAMTTPSIDMSGSQKATLIFSAFYPADATRMPVEFNSYLSNSPGSFGVQFTTSPNGLLRGVTASENNVINNNGQIGFDARLLSLTFEFDTSQASIATQIKARTGGVGASSSSTGGTLQAAFNFANAALGVGSNNLSNARAWNDLIHRVVVIDRLLTSAERANAEAWVKEDMAYCAVLGDSTSAWDTSGSLTNFARRTSSLVGGMVVGLADVATAGDQIASQKTKWNAIVDKSALQAVFIQIGINDCRLGPGASRTVASITADLQDLVNTVRAGAPAGCKIYLCTMTPCKSFLNANGTPTTSYQFWQGINNNILGTGANPITGADAIISGHTAALNDGADSLLGIYDVNPDGVHYSTEARFVVAQYWRAQLEADGLLKAAA